MNRFVSLAPFALLSFAGMHLVAQALPQGCGTPSAQYKVHTEKTPLAAAGAAGMGRIVFVQKLAGEFNNAPLTRFAVDGSWVGADKGRSFSATDVTPGQHTVCASRQGNSQEEKSNTGSVAVSVARGETAYVEFTITRTEIGALDTHASSNITGRNGNDMTAKQRDTYDTATIASSTSMNAEELAKLPMSVAVAK